MRIGFEASVLQGCKSGVGYYAENLLAGMMAVAPQHDYVLFSNRDLRESREPIADERVYDRGFFPVRAAWMQTVLPGNIRRAAPDVCHFPNYLAPLASHCPYVVTIHDMTLYITPRFHRFKKLVLDRTLLPHVARRAAGIVTVSNSAREDIVRHLKVPRDKVRVVMNAVSPMFRPVTDPALLSAVLARYGIDVPYILFVGTIEPRKNIARLVQAFARLKRAGYPHKLVLVGQPGWHFEPIYAEIEQQGVKRDVILTGYVPLEDLPVLYSAAESMAFPSLYEGFGLPVLEAMACGTPVVTSASSSLAEVAGGTALLVDPFSIEQITDALARLHDDPQLAGDLAVRGMARAARFTWANAARATLDLYDKVLAPKAALACPPAPRIARSRD
jgi:glycosyltransferase involved in cell wall biosynthesis